jgi:hypothetical protein
MRVTETHKPLLASCTDSLCAGAEQEEIEGLERLTEFTFGDLRAGPTSDPHDAFLADVVERSTVNHFFATEADRWCPVCGQPRLISDQVRPVYPRMSEREPLYLAKLQKGLTAATTELAKAAGGRDEEMSAMRARMLQQDARIAALNERLAQDGASAGAPEPPTATNGTEVSDGPPATSRPRRRADT